MDLIQRKQLRPAIDCRQMVYEEHRQDFAYPSCPDLPLLLSKLSADLIRRVRPADCTITTGPKSCLGIEYWDPAAPRTNSLYVVTMADEARPRTVEIRQVMLPPH